MVASTRHALRFIRPFLLSLIPFANAAHITHSCGFDWVKQHVEYHNITYIYLFICLYAQCRGMHILRIRWIVEHSPLIRAFVAERRVAIMEHWALWYSSAHHHTGHWGISMYTTCKITPNTQNDEVNDVKRPTGTSVISLSILMVSVCALNLLPKSVCFFPASCITLAQIWVSWRPSRMTTQRNTHRVSWWSAWIATGEY